MSESQRLDEWSKLDPAGVEYHVRQWREPKRSTVAFEEFIRPRLQAQTKVVDLACGAGAATAFLARRHPDIDWLGIDYSPELILMAAQVSRKESVRNVAFRQGDWFELEELQDVDGVVTLQTLSWLPEFERPMTRLFEALRPRWMAISSLFYSGDITCRTEIEEHSRGVRQFYNTYSLPAVDRHCATYGYRVAKAVPFVIDVDLARPANRDVMGTFTVRTSAPAEDAVPLRLQISGPLLMNWQFVLIEKQ
jgi:SAM-dependent methyltransferase